jgi:transcriptional regulator with XRE-family HTH domain
MAFYWRNQSFPERLRYFQKKFNIKNKDLAEKLNVSVSTVGYWLSGKREPSDSHISELCELFEVNHLELMHTPEELSEGNLRFLFKKHNLNIESFERFDQLEDLLSEYFIDNISKFRRKKE